MADTPTCHVYKHILNNKNWMQINFNSRNSQGEIKIFSTNKTSHINGHLQTPVWDHSHDAVVMVKSWEEHQCQWAGTANYVHVDHVRDHEKWGCRGRKGAHRHVWSLIPVCRSAWASVHHSQCFSLWREITGGFPSFFLETLLCFSIFYRGIY